LGVAERERVRPRLRWPRRVAQRGVDRPRPCVVLVSLPDEQHETGLGAQRGGDVGERGGGSEKNIVPKRLIATSKAAGSKRWTWASPSS
jgi:hypothetical protein